MDVLIKAGRPYSVLYRRETKLIKNIGVIWASRDKVRLESEWGAVSLRFKDETTAHDFVETICKEEDGGMKTLIIYSPLCDRVEFPNLPGRWEAVWNR